MSTLDDSAISPIRTPDELLGLVPHLLGFHPAESLVVLVVGDSRLDLTARLDLADALQEGQLVNLLGRILARFPAARAWAIAYSADREGAWEVLEQAEGILGGRCLGILYVDGLRWWSGRARPGGRYRPLTAVSAVEATVRGLPARPSRSELVRALEPAPEEAEALAGTLQAQVERLSRRPPNGWPRAVTRLLGDLARQDRAPSDSQCARLAILTLDAPTRDRVLCGLSEKTAQHHLRVWSQVVRRVPPWISVHATSLLGLAAWVSGDGALANVCVDRVAALTAEVPMVVEFLKRTTEDVLPPSMWEEVRPALVEAVHLEEEQRRPRRRRAAGE